MYSVCLMVSKLFLSECVEAGLSSDRKLEKFAVGTQVLLHTQNVVISRCCFAEDGYEMYQDLLCTCRAIVLLIKPFVLPCSCCRCRRGLLKVPIVLCSWARYLPLTVPLSTQEYNALDSRLRGLDSSPGWVIVLCFWARHITLTCTVPLSAQKYKWVLMNCQGNLIECWVLTAILLASH